ncbi:DUF6152 family protein [Asticcacaulis sp. AC402]|uniref:DUF6152 family protein n=1 Tax=Asticcacaulis sp. AC402 TaxID=1282361 RepID=UPI0003C4092C|nr:DUF6152 family protein [Asticcacaulis sp. AC402]ESQ76660.1 hypothetical protein ABAC402_03010 [Asticcacaulis sp. AC402]
MTPVVAKRRVLKLLTVAALVAATPVLAHHGWAWTEEKQTTLTGTIQSISMVPPHPVLKVKAADGVLWQVDLGNPVQTEKSGFRGDTAKVGDSITVLGNRALDKTRHMKAVRITLAGKNYDMYPDRIHAH